MVVHLGPVTRIRELDALRGFAVGGIMLVNTWQHTEKKPPVPLDWTIEALFQSRFYPIFSMLFGISFLLFLRGHSRWTLLSRLVWLFLIGKLQHLFYAGEVLTDYAFFGALVLLPASFLPGALPVLLLGAVVTAWALLPAVGGGVLLIPGLFLLGMGLWRLRPGRTLLLPGFATAAVASALLSVAWVLTDEWTVYSLAALAGAAAYSLGLLLALGPRLSAVLEPLGKMALTNYVSGTAVIVLAKPLLDADPTRWAVVALAAVTIAAQILFSRWWLGRYRYGPLEWVWRCLTLFRLMPNRLESACDQNRPLPDPGVS
ncbi:putative membrane protein YeiB [Nonomuraea fuscirosea]|uniref:Putative membrane protein YeiB n=1 Tax=Nonomuraea fuscirosea TaxID=1291556 RepID=A0A2T0NBA0_9ACTN|nr:putative membrane protein YeiB [Nonomuraea fuscirosea]